MNGVLMTSDRGAADEAAAWKRAAKERLTGLVRLEGSQRKLAARWLGDVSKANQVSEWCNPDNHKFPETANLVKLRQLDVSLNWLLADPDAQNENGENKWPPDRVAGLSDELDKYCDDVMFDHLWEKAKGRGYSSANRLLVLARAGNETRGDFLSYLTRHLKRLVDRAYNDLYPYHLNEEIQKWKRRAWQAERRLKEQTSIQPAKGTKKAQRAKSPRKRKRRNAS
jgi:hypothetical protein